jgi:hypothetical protein
MQNISNQGWSIRTENAAGSGKIVFAMLQNVTTNELRVTTTNNHLQIGSWTHIVMTFSGNSLASGVTIYINGTAVALTTNLDVLTTNPSSSVTMHVGANAAASPSNFFLGNVDELSIWNRVLTAGEVTTIYNLGKPNDLAAQSFYASAAIYWWRMGDNDTFPVLVEQKGTGTSLQMYNSVSTQIDGAVP